jgi:hypothetical protein
VNRATTSGDAFPLQAYYNTDSANLNLKAASNINAVAVVNMQGAVVATRRYAGDSSEEEISVERLPTGVYIARVETSSGTCTAKFIR